MPLTPDQMMNAIIANLSAKTGKSFEEWCALIKAQNFNKESDIVVWLKKEHNIGTVTARIMVEKVFRPGPSIYSDGDSLVQAQYSGEFAGLRPLYEKLVECAKSLGSDVTISPRKTYVSLIRNRQFAVIQAGKGKVLLGLTLPGKTASEILKTAKNLGSERITHKIEVAKFENINDEVVSYLKKAFEEDKS